MRDSSNCWIISVYRSQVYVVFDLENTTTRHEQKSFSAKERREEPNLAHTAHTGVFKSNLRSDGNC